MIVLFNPTDEDMNPQYSGYTYIVKAGGGQLKVEDAAANHILSRFTDRGLCKLEFGDEARIPEISKEGLERWMEFRKRMVVKHNQMNTTRAQVGQTYLQPPTHIKRYARDLGITLDEPFAQKRNEHEMELSGLVRENADLKSAVATLTQQMSVLMELVTEGKQPGKGSKKQQPDA